MPAQSNDDIEEIKHSLSAIVESNDKILNLRINEQWEQRDKLLNRRMLFLFVLLCFSFILLAFRTEQNAHDIQDGFYEACITRSNQAAQSNLNREVLVQLAINEPDVSPEKRSEYTKILRDALLLPIEVCG